MAAKVGVMGKTRQVQTKQKQTKSKATNQPASEVESESSKAGCLPGKAKKEPAKRKRKSAQSRDGGGKLREAVVQRVAEECDRIAESLVNKTLEGNMVGAKLLVDLTGAKIPPPKPPRKRRGPTMAQMLAACPPWQGPLDDVEDYDPPLPEPVAS